VGQVGEIHQPERHGQPDREQKEQHPQGEAVEQHARKRRDHTDCAGFARVKVIACLTSSSPL
jgi:hypothetical protein